MSYKYFIYSSEELKFRKSIETKMGKKFNVGHVIVSGVKKPFTSLSSSSTSRYSDAKIVTEGDTDSIVYTMPEGK